MSIVLDRPVSTARAIEFAWLELTPSCQLHCSHCYRSSAPGLGHGTMKASDWMRVIQELRDTGVKWLQFIGGEPTLYPQFMNLLIHAGELGFGIEVYSNLLSIPAPLWRAFVHYKVRVATSVYSQYSSIHDEITGLPGSHSKTLHNLQRSLQLGLTTRVGIVHMREDQDIAATIAFLTQVGVDPSRIGADRIRGVGRGAQTVQESPTQAMCGKCTKNRCAITPDGEVYPCIMGRSFSFGNVLRQSIQDIIASPTTASTITMLDGVFAARRANVRDAVPCDPDECDPVDWPPCDPDCCPATVASCEPSEEE